MSESDDAKKWTPQKVVVVRPSDSQEFDSVLEVVQELVPRQQNMRADEMAEVKNKNKDTLNEVKDISGEYREATKRLRLINEEAKSYLNSRGIELPNPK